MCGAEFVGVIAVGGSFCFILYLLQRRRFHIFQSIFIEDSYIQAKIHECHTFWNMTFMYQMYDTILEMYDIILQNVWTSYIFLGLCQDTPIKCGSTSVGVQSHTDQSYMYETKKNCMKQRRIEWIKNCMKQEELYELMYHVCNKEELYELISHYMNFIFIEQSFIHCETYSYMHDEFHTCQWWVSYMSMYEALFWYEYHT